MVWLGIRQGWFARMDTEFSNLRAAITWLLESGDGTRALRLIVGIDAYVSTRAIQGEARRWVDTAMRLAAGAPAILRAAALYGLITHTAHLGDLAASVAAAVEALRLAETTEDPFALGRAHYGLGMVWNRRGDVKRATEAYARAVPYFRRTGRLDFLASAYTGLGDMHHRAGNLQDARAALDEAISLHGQIDDPTWSTGTLLGRGHLARAENDPALAVRLFTESLELAREVAFEQAMLSAMAGLAAIALDLGQPERAARLFGAVAARQNEVGIPQYLGRRPYPTGDRASPRSAWGGCVRYRV